MQSDHHTSHEAVIWMRQHDWRNYHFLTLWQ